MRCTKLIRIKDADAKLRQVTAIMATASLSPELASMAAFRAALGRGAGSRRTVERLCAVGRYGPLARGAVLTPDSADDRFVFIASGATKLVVQVPGVAPPHPDDAAERQWHSQILGFHFPGEIVALMRQADREFRLAALSDSDLVIFSVSHFLDVAQGDPAVIRAVLARSLEALQASHDRMMQLGHRSARQRVADFLVSIARRLGGCPVGSCELHLPMSRSDIADSLGLTIETVSRQLTDLKLAGLVSTAGRSTICLCDTSALMREAWADNNRAITPEA
jgi:CRP/FNR family transcriptional regulator